MIQFNLLPEVKLEYVKARRTKRVTILVATLVAAGSLAILVLLFFAVQILQKKHASDLTKDIKTETTALQGVENIDKILTIQNQLNSLTGLHDKKPVATRLFTFIRQVTPAEVTVASFKIDFEAQTIEATGAANSIGSVNKFADTLKFTTYKIGDQEGELAFSEVVLASFGKDDKGTSYQLTFKFNPIIFDSANEVALQIPAGKITTRSQTEKPDSLFQPLSNPEEEQQ